MMKGQEEEAGMTFGVLVAAFTFMAIFVIFNFIGTNVAFADTLDRAHAVEFANLVKSRLAGDDGMVSYGKLVDTGHLGELGLSKKEVVIDNLITKERFLLVGEAGTYYHETYMTIKGDFFPVMNASKVILEKGNTYLLHIHRNSKNNIFLDIYEEPVCSEGAQNSELRILSCQEMSPLAENRDLITLDSKTLKGFIDSAGSGSVITETVVPVADLRLEDALEGYSPGFPTDCISGAETMCCRIVGSYTYPATLLVSIDRGENFIGG
jgi:hypothetical protein